MVGAPARPESRPAAPLRKRIGCILLGASAGVRQGAGIVRNPIKIFSLVAGLLAVLLLGFIDLLTNRELPFSIFYILPVTMAAWGHGRWAGILLAALSALLWFAADLSTAATATQLLIALLSMVLRFAFFSTATYVVTELRARLAAEEALARIDPLTQVANRRYFFELAEAEIRRSLRYGHPFTVAYLDLDNFKLVNDRFGHHTGDTILKLVATVIENNLRKFDSVARLGGDEFAILLPEAGQEAARPVMLRLQNLLVDAVQAKNCPVTFSIGVVTFVHQPDSVDEMLEQVDRLMYKVKHDGKNNTRFETIQ